MQALAHHLVVMKDGVVMLAPTMKAVSVLTEMIRYFPAQSDSAKRISVCSHVRGGSTHPSSKCDCCSYKHDACAGTAAHLCVPGEEQQHKTVQTKLHLLRVIERNPLTSRRNKILEILFRNSLFSARP
jgi:hypothetical protein